MLVLLIFSWWTNPGLTGWLVGAGAVLFIVLLVISLLPEPPWAKEQGASSQDDSAVGLGVGAAVAILAIPVAVVVLALSAYRSAQNLLDESDPSTRPPVIVNFVLPVTRGVMIVGEDSVCVDKVGSRVMVGGSSIRGGSDLGRLRGQGLRARGRLDPLRPARSGTPLPLAHPGTAPTRPPIGRVLGERSAGTRNLETGER